MPVAALIPWRGGCAHRERALEWVTGRYSERHPDWEIVIGIHDNGPWCKASAVAEALRRTTADLLVIADADVWVDNLDTAVDHCETWAIPHRLVNRLDEPSTLDLYNTGTPGAGRTQRPYLGYAGGGIVVVRRDVYQACPFDRRYLGWGQEDASLALALTALYGEAWRGTADLIHLFHPPQKRLTRRVGSDAGRRLFTRYRNASRSPESMAALIAEATSPSVHAL